MVAGLRSIAKAMGYHRRLPCARLLSTLLVRGAHSDMRPYRDLYLLSLYLLSLYLLSLYLLDRM